nr:uncharacterized protein LOC103241837 [Chlorocebus sabaeus]
MEPTLERTLKGAFQSPKTSIRQLLGLWLDREARVKGQVKPEGARERPGMALSMEGLPRFPGYPQELLQPLSTCLGLCHDGGASVADTTALTTCPSPRLSPRTRFSGEVVGSEPEGVPSQFRERWCGVDEASEDTVETVEHQRTQSEEAGQLDASPVRPPTVCSQSLRSCTGSTRGHSSWTGSNRAYSSWTGSSRVCSSWTGSSRVCSSWTGSRMTHSLRSSSRAYSSWIGSSHKKHSPPWSPHRSHSPPWSPHRSHSWSRNRLAHSSTQACSSRQAHSSWSHSPHSQSHNLRSSHSSPWFWWIEGGAGRGTGEREVQVWSSLSLGPLYPWVG